MADKRDRYTISESARDALASFDAAPVRPDLSNDTMYVQVANRITSIHLAIEQVIKFFIANAGETIAKTHDLNRLYRDLKHYDSEKSDFLAASFVDAVHFFGYNTNKKEFKHCRSLDTYLARVGTEDVFNLLRYWVVGEEPKGDDPIPYILLQLHRELLYCVWRLTFPKGHETVSERVERIVKVTMFEGRHIAYASEDIEQKQTVGRYISWLREHLPFCNALTKAVDRDFEITNEPFISKMTREAYEELRQSDDPAVRYFIQTLSYMPEGSQRIAPDAIPEVELNTIRTRGMVSTPAGEYLGFVYGLPDGAWYIVPSVTTARTQGIAVAKTLKDAKAYLVNLLTRRIMVTVNSKERPLRMFSDTYGEYFVPEISGGWDSETIAFDDTEYKVGLWDARHGLLVGDEVKIRMEPKENTTIIAAIQGVITEVKGHEIVIKGSDWFIKYEEMLSN